jgi:polar amino acid transport system substrate-binding protein
MNARGLNASIFFLAGALCFATGPGTVEHESGISSPLSPLDTPLSIYCEFDPPFQFKDESGRATGYAVDLVREIQKRAGNDDPIQIVPWARGYNEVLKTPYTVLFSMARTAERESLFHWVGPFSEIEYGFYSLAESPLRIESLDDARSVRAIGVYQNDVRDLYLTANGFTNLERVNDNVSNMRKLFADRIDLFTGSNLSIQGELDALGKKSSDIKLQYVFLRIGVYAAFSSATPPEVARVWSEAFASMLEDGTFRAIWNRYYPED